MTVTTVTTVTFFFRIERCQQRLHERRLLFAQDLVRGTHRRQEGTQTRAQHRESEPGQNPEDPAGLQTSGGKERRAEEGTHLR